MPDSKSAGVGKLCTVPLALAAGTCGNTIVGRLGVRSKLSADLDEGWGQAVRLLLELLLAMLEAVVLGLLAEAVSEE